jgi:hypothetical protein
VRRAGAAVSVFVTVGLFLGLANPGAIAAAATDLSVASTG